MALLQYFKFTTQPKAKQVLSEKEQGNRLRPLVRNKMKI